VINSWYERDIDSIMKRTSKRPIPKGKITPGKALAFGVVSVVTGVSIGLLFLNSVSALLIGAGAIWYAVVYTIIFKRRTKWNILVGGFAGIFPVLACWTAAQAPLTTLFPWILSFLIWIWIPLHFWALAIKYLDDYEAANLPMLPVIIGPEKTVTHISISGLLILLTVLGMAFLPETHLVFILLTLPLCLWLLKVTLIALRKPSKRNAWRLFRTSNVFLALVLGILILDSAFLIYYS
jgi:protoheme IX farnesyltransferase